MATPVVCSFTESLPVRFVFTSLWLKLVETLTSDVPPAEDSCHEGSIDLKCKERVTDSDEDESDGQVAVLNRVHSGL